MRLAIVRHGEAAMNSNDAARQLTEYGHQQAERLAAWLAQQSWQQPVLWASPYVRAQQTAQHIADACSLSIQTQTHVTPEGNLQQIVEGLITQQQDLIFVSHQPLVGCLASLLLHGQSRPVSWQTTECWVLEGEIFAANCMDVLVKYRP